jgi:Bacterial regulatory proteins, tetR family
MSPVRDAVARKSGCLSSRNTCGLQSARTTVSYDFLMVTLRIVNRDTHRTKVPAPLKATASKRSKTAATPVVRGTTTKKRAPKSPKPATNLELREDSIRRLSEASFALFVAKGYHATSLDEIARAAGLTKGSIYFYFNSKQRLLLGLLEDAREAVVSPLLDHVHKIEGSATDKIAGFFRFSSQADRRDI